MIDLVGMHVLASLGVQNDQLRRRGFSGDGGEHTIDAGLDRYSGNGCAAGRDGGVAPIHGEGRRDHIHDCEAGADCLPEQNGVRLACRPRPHDLGPAVVLAGSGDKGDADAS